MVHATKYTPTGKMKDFKMWRFNVSNERSSTGKGRISFPDELPRSCDWISALEAIEDEMSWRWAIKNIVHVWDTKNTSKVRMIKPFSRSIYSNIILKFFSDIQFQKELAGCDKACGGREYGTFHCSFKRNTRFEKCGPLSLDLWMVKI